MAVVMVEVLVERLAGFKGDDGQERVAGERQIEGGSRAAMPVRVFLPEGDVALVVVAGLHPPVAARGAGTPGFLRGQEAGEEDAGVAVGLAGLVLVDPVAGYLQDRAGAVEADGDGVDRSDGGLAGVDAPVAALRGLGKKGEPAKAWLAAWRRLAVLPLVPTR